MAILATAQWWVRTSGGNANGGGYDSGIGGAATNYCDQDAAQASWTTELSTAGIGSTALTDTSGLFTSAMIGNAIRISAGTNVVAGYYFVTAYADVNNVTIDRACDDGVGGLASGTGKLGGAFATLQGSLTDGGTTGTPTITTPLAAGHIVNIRGTGSLDPATVDYSLTGYLEFPNGSITVGKIKFLGYNGRPAFDSTDTRIFWQGNEHQFEHLKFLNGRRIDGGGTHGRAHDCIFDAGGNDVVLCGSVHSVTDCWFKNTGATTAGTAFAIINDAYAGAITGNVFSDLRSGAIQLVFWGHAYDNLIHDCGGIGIEVAHVDGNGGGSISGNTIENCGSDGIKFTGSLSGITVWNNLITNSGGYALNASTGTATPNDKEKGMFDYNFLYNSSSSHYNNLSAGPNDVALSASPYVGASDFHLNDTAGGGSAVRGAAFPGALLDGVHSSYRDGGALQHQDAGGGLSFVQTRRNTLIGR